VSAFRDEVASQVRPAQFGDLQQGLIQGLSTGIQNELDKPGRQPADQMAVRRVLRLAPRPVFLAGREELLAELDARLAGDDDAGPQVELPRVSRTGNFQLIYAAVSIPSSSSMTSRGVLYPSVE
jgi:hypothetical protein